MIPTTTVGTTPIDPREHLEALSGDGYGDVEAAAVDAYPGLAGAPTGPEV